MDSILIQIEITLKQEYCYLKEFEAKMIHANKTGQNTDCIIEYIVACMDTIQRLERMKKRMRYG